MKEEQERRQRDLEELTSQGFTPQAKDAARLDGFVRENRNSLTPAQVRYTPCLDCSKRLDHVLASSHSLSSVRSPPHIQILSLTDRCTCADHTPTAQDPE